MPYEGYQLTTLEWCLFAIATPLVFIRLYVQFTLRTRPCREAFVMSAWLLYLATTILHSVANGWDYNNVASREHLEKSGEGMYPLAKVIFAESFFYKITIYCCKAALLCLYHDITPPHYIKTWWAIKISWLLIIIGALFQILLNLFDYWPFWKNWNLTYGGCSYSQPLKSTSWAFHLSTDIIVYLIPFFILGKLRNLTAEQKRSAYVMFGLGLFNIVAALITVVNYAIPLDMKDDDLKGLNGFDDVTVFLCVLQTHTAVIIVCLPQVRRLWLGLSAEALRPELGRLGAAIADVERGSSLTLIATPGNGSEVLLNRDR